MNVDLAMTAKFMQVWHKYVVICDLTWPHSKYSHLPNRTKEVLIDICSKLGIECAPDASKKDMIAAMLEHEL